MGGWMDGWMVDPLCHSEISYTMVVNGPRYAGPHFFKKKNGAPLRGAPMKGECWPLSKVRKYLLSFYLG